MKRYLTIWLKFTLFSFQSSLINRFGFVLFFLGKVLRFIFFSVFLLLLVKKTETLAGFTVEQILLFYLSFTLIDTLAQLLFRGAYMFRSHVVNGTFDFFLIKPLSPLFRALATNTDLIDLLTLFPILSLIAYVLATMTPAPSLLHIALYIILLINALAIAFAIHVVIVSIGILTLEIENTLWLYRDISSLGRVPVDVYNNVLRGVITYVVPIAVMMTFPTKAVLGVLSPQGIMVAFTIAFASSTFALWLWRFALKRYASASS